METEIARRVDLSRRRVQQLNKIAGGSTSWPTIETSKHMDLTWKVMTGSKQQKVSEDEIKANLQIHEFSQNSTRIGVFLFCHSENYFWVIYRVRLYGVVARRSILL